MERDNACIGGWPLAPAVWPVLLLLVEREGCIHRMQIPPTATMVGLLLMLLMLPMLPMHQRCYFPGTGVL